MLEEPVAGLALGSRPTYLTGLPGKSFNSLGIMKLQPPRLRVSSCAHTISVALR
jgi:hypothetical protein